MGQTLTKCHGKTTNKKDSMFESKEENFIGNGGLLQEKFISLSQSQHIVAAQLKIFSKEDIEKATNNYDLELLLASSELRTVYKGTLEGRTIAVKAPPLGNPHPILIDHHLTEASMSMAMSHPNVLKLYGCCLETRVPILVHDYFHSSLSEHLHVNEIRQRLHWADVLRITIETGYALSYMHNGLSKPVVHRHLTARNILLDYSFHSKLSNFGFSVPITPGETPQRWPVAGALGYIDPEHVETQEVTEKCDVYSFGVLLLEILTRKKPYMMASRKIDLVSLFISAVEKDYMIEIIDKEVLEQASRDELLQLSQLALTCVERKGSDRPTMIEVVEQLLQIHGQARGQMNCQ